MGIDQIDNIIDKSASPSGPNQVSFLSLAQKHPMAKAWNQVFKEMGYPTTAELFPTQSTGNRCYTASIDPQTNKRISADSQYGNAAATRPNLTIITDATVIRLLLSRSSLSKIVARGVEATINGESCSIMANKEVILSAGAFHSAKLLELSGVGDPSRLEHLNIPLVIDNANVGENLQNHTMCIRTFELEQGVQVGDGIQSLAFLPLEDRELQKEMFDKNAQPRVADNNNNNERDFHDVVRAVFDSPGEASCSVFMTFTGVPEFASLGVMQSIPFSRGSSHIATADPNDNPRIDPQFFSDPLDLDIMAQHLLFLEKLPLTDPLSGFFKKKDGQRPAALTDIESAKTYLREHAMTTYHACGAAAMLPRAKGGVVDQNLIVYDTTNLRIVDASIFPVIPQANPMSTVYAVAEKAADLIKGDHT